MTDFKGIVICKDKATYEGIANKDADKLYVVEGEDLLKLYHATGQNTDGAIDQKVVTNALATKQDSLNSTQLEAVNSGINTTKVTTYDGYAPVIAGKSTVTGSASAVSGATDIKNINIDGTDWGVPTLTLEAVYPVGSVYMNASNNANPATIFGFGTWASIGAGRCLIGVDTNDSDFATVGQTGGEKTHTLSVNEMPSHTHVQNAHTHTQDAHTHSENSEGNHSHVISRYMTNAGGSSSYYMMQPGDYGSNDYDHVRYSENAGSHTHTINSTTATNQNTTATNQNTGGSTAHNNVQPYLTVYMWKRTA